MSSLPARPHREDPIIETPRQHLDCRSIQSGKPYRKILIYIYEDGSSGYCIITRKDKGKKLRIREVTDKTAEVIRDVAHFGHVVCQTDMSYYGPTDPYKPGIKSNIACIPTDKQEQANTNDSLDSLLGEINRLINGSKPS